MDIKQRFWDIVASGLDKDAGLDVLRKVILVNVLVVVGNFFLVSLMILAVVQHNLILAAADLVVFIILTSLFLFLRKTKRYIPVSIIGTVTAGCFFFFLVATGGTNNTAYAWIFTYPLVALFLLGSVWGTVAAGLLWIASGLVFFLGGTVSLFTTYDPNLAIRVMSVYLTIYLFVLVMEKVRDAVQLRLWAANSNLERNIGQLQQTLDEIKTLQGILPICMNCKKIRDDTGYWERVERYIQKRSDATFSHGICPECVDQLYPELKDE